MPDHRGDNETPLTVRADGMTMSQWNLMYCTSGSVLRAACKGEGLPVSGTNWQRGERLAKAGHTHDEIITKYGRPRRR